MDKTLTIVNPFAIGDDGSLSDQAWSHGCKVLGVAGWRFVQCALRVRAAWTDETLQQLKKTSGVRQQHS